MTKRQAPYRHADDSTCWTKNCSRGHKSAEASATAAPATLDDFITGATRTTPPTPDEQVARLESELVRPGNATVDYDSIAKELDYVRKWEEPWTPEEQANLKTVRKIAKLTERAQFGETEEAQVRELIGNMKPAANRFSKRSQFGSFPYRGQDNRWRARDKMLNALANNLLVRRLAENLPQVPASERTNERLLGLREAQEAALAKGVNRAQYYRNGETYLGEVEPYFQSAIARVASGEELPQVIGEAESPSLLPEHERIFAVMHPDYEHGSAPQLYLAAVWPVNELKAEMERAGIDNVSVSPFYNTREWGNAYTVVTPDGSTRTFSVYEHRNSDSIIINGTENWNGEDLPYAADNKQAFFAEFSYNDHERAAQALTFYLTQAQSGELEPSAELVRKVSRLDWTAILDKSIPGFKAWSESQTGTRYITPEQETDVDVLKRLDF